MLIPATEYRIHDVTAPVHLQGLESLFLFVGGLDTVSAIGIVVIHHHRIDTQLDNIGADDSQAPEKKRLQQVAEQKHPRPGKRLEEPLDLMGRGHVCAIGLDAAGIPLILTKLIEISQPSAGAINEKAQHLLEKFRNGQSLPVFTDEAEPAFEPAKDLNAVQIGHEQGKAGSAGQPVGSGFDATNFQFILPVFLLCWLIESFTFWVCLCLLLTWRFLTSIIAHYPILKDSFFFEIAHIKSW
jgi:hypothetical protein